MRSSAHIKGHPIHPMLVGFPVAYLIGGALIDVWARVSKRPAWFRTASHMNVLGLGSAVAAAIPGLIDYMYAVPPKSSAKRRATSHMLTNVSALGFFLLARLARGHKEDDEGPGSVALGAELAGAGLLTAGSWMGGTLVFRNQIAVDHRYANAGRWRVERELSAGGAFMVEADLDVDQMKLVHVGDRRIVVARTERGYAAFDDRCTHRGGPLSDGALVCGTVQCPWHGSQFDVTTGRVNQGPAEDAIRTYAVEEANGCVYVMLDQGLKS